MKNSLKYIYGPVESWRMGKSLGIDPLSDRAKICNMDCGYCQLGRTRILTDERKNYIPTDTIVHEIAQFFDIGQKDSSWVQGIDYITFSGRGEPTLAENLGEMIQGVRKIRQEKIAVITNATLLYVSEVRKDLLLTDLILAKLDAFDNASFLKMAGAVKGSSFDKILDWLKCFKCLYRGKLAIQIMFTQDNQRYVREISEVIRNIDVDEIQLNTSLRPSAAKPLGEEEMKEIKSYFVGMPTVSVYERDRKATIPFDECSTIKRHGNYINTF